MANETTQRRASTPGTRGRASDLGLDGRNLERRLARAVVSLVRDHQDAIQKHRALAITVFVDTKTGEVRQSFILAGRE